MRYSIICILLLFIISFFSCAETNYEETNHEEKECKVKGIVIDCNKAKVYNAFLEKEAIINSTFEENAPAIEFEDALKLRKDIIAFYDKNQSILDQVHDKIKDSVTVMPLKQVLEMRKGEIQYFEDQIKEREATAAFMKNVQVSTYKVDTSLYEGSKKRSYLVMKVTNNSDRTITGVNISKNYIVDNELKKPKNPTLFLFTHDQLSPSPPISEDAHLLPGHTLTLYFETSKREKAQPEIISFSFSDS